MVTAKTGPDISNALRVVAYGAPGGTPAGTVSVESTSGQSYSGPVRCLRVSGHNASFVAAFSSSTGEPASIKGGVWWLHDGAGNNDPSGQRNALLTQRSLDTKYATCPDPALPPGGSFRAVLGGNGITITGP